MSAKIRIISPYGEAFEVEVSDRDSAILGLLCGVENKLEKRLHEKYEEMHENNSVYGQVTSGQFKTDANVVLNILDDIIFEYAIEAGAKYSICMEKEDE